MQFKPNNKIYLICDPGALGDTICTFPIIQKLIEQNGIEKMFVGEKYKDLYYLIFPNHLLVNSKEVTVTIPKEQVTPDIPKEVIDPKTGEATFLSYPLIPNIPVVHTHNRSSALSMHAHLIDGYSVAISNCILKEQDKSYPRVQKDKLPESPLKGRRYVVVSYGSTSENRRMLPEVFNDIKKHIFSKGYEVVLLGSRSHTLNIQGGCEIKATFEGLDTDGCIDMIDKTNVKEVLSIIAGSEGMIGIDGGLLHLAGMTDVPIVMGFTTVDPYYRIPYRDGIKGHNVFVVEPDGECKYCQTTACNGFGFFYHICNTKTFSCTNSLTTDKWLVQIDKVLNDVEDFYKMNDSFFKVINNTP